MKSFVTKTDYNKTKNRKIFQNNTLTSFNLLIVLLNELRERYIKF